MGNACTAYVWNGDKCGHPPRTWMNVLHCLLCLLKKSTGIGILTENKDGIKRSVVTL